jgi:FAD:protein FMN transferase
MTNDTKQEFPTFHRTFPAMGTRFDVVLPNLDPEIANFIYQEIQIEVCVLDVKLSRFLADSIVSEINRHAYQRPIRVDLEMWDILTICQRYHELTNGAFDITVLPLLLPVSLSHQFNKNHVGFDKVRLDQNTMSISFTRPGMGLDLGGIGKGYALENVKRILHTHNILQAFLSFGDSSILAWGAHPLNPHWCVGIQHLYDRRRTVHEFFMKDQALSTSANGHRNNGVPVHIYDPRTGMPGATSTAVSVVSESPLETELLSTALLVLEDHEKQSVLRHFPECTIAEMVFYDRGEMDFRTWNSKHPVQRNCA